MEFLGTAQEWCEFQQDELTIFEIDNGNLRVDSKSQHVCTCASFEESRAFGSDVGVVSQ